jgi:hypothetical protein
MLTRRTDVFVGTDTIKATTVVAGSFMPAIFRSAASAWVFLQTITGSPKLFLFPELVHREHMCGI